MFCYILNRPLEAAIIWRSELAEVWHSGLKRGAGVKRIGLNNVSENYVSSIIFCITIIKHGLGLKHCIRDFESYETISSLNKILKGKHAKLESSSDSHISPLSTQRFASLLHKIPGTQFWPKLLICLSNKLYCWLTLFYLNLFLKTLLQKRCFRFALF